jgi:predicted Fe-S protein YdhL (DUF1289 family)
MADKQHQADLRNARRAAERQAQKQALEDLRAAVFPNRPSRVAPTPDPTPATAPGGDADPAAGHPTDPADADEAAILPDNRAFCFGCHRWRERVGGWNGTGKCDVCKAYAARALYDSEGNLIKPQKKKAPPEGRAS